MGTQIFNDITKVIRRVLNKPPGWPDSFNKKYNCSQSNYCHIIFVIHDILQTHVLTRLWLFTDFMDTGEAVQTLWIWFVWLHSGLDNLIITRLEKHPKRVLGPGRNLK